MLLDTMLSDTMLSGKSIYRAIKRGLSFAGLALVLSSLVLVLSTRVALAQQAGGTLVYICLLYTSPSPRD